MEQQSTVYIVDDDQQMRSALVRTLKSAGFSTEAFSSAQIFLDSGKYALPGCLILDQKMPELSGLELQQRLLEQNAPLPIIFLTGSGDVPSSVQAIKKGAFDYLEKPFDRDTLYRVVRAAIDADLKSRLKKMQRSLEEQQLSSLTRREKEVMQWLVDGKSNKEIARILHISFRTVEIHRANIMRKMKVDSVAGLVKVCLSLSS